MATSRSLSLKVTGTHVAVTAVVCALAVVAFTGLTRTAQSLDHVTRQRYPQARALAVLNETQTDVARAAYGLLNPAVDSARRAELFTESERAFVRVRNAWVGYKNVQLTGPEQDLQRELDVQWKVWESAALHFVELQRAREWLRASHLPGEALLLAHIDEQAAELLAQADATYRSTDVMIRKLDLLGDQLVEQEAASGASISRQAKGMLVIGIAFSLALLIFLGARLSATIDADVQALLARARSLTAAVDSRTLEARADVSHLTPEFQPVVQSMNRTMEAFAAAERALQESEARYRLLANNAGDWIALLDADGRFLYSSPGAELEGVLHHRLVEHCYPEDAPRLSALFTHRPADPPASPVQWRCRVTDHEFVWLETTCRVVSAPPEGPTRLVLVSRDVTARKATEEALGEARTLHSAVVESTRDLIWAVDAKTLGLLSFNPAFAEAFHATYGVRVRTGMTPSELGELAWTQYYQRALEGEPLIVDDVSVDGAHTLQLRFNLLWRGGTIFGISVFGQDVTDRVAAEAALRDSQKKMRALASKLQSAREVEKTRIARDLHDELGQLLTGLNIDLTWIEDRLDELEPSAEIQAIYERVVEASELSDRTVKQVQKIATDLRPATLDRLGLGEALKQEGRTFEGRSGLPCEVQVDERAPLPGDVATALYRIAQEALTNIARHARATRVSIKLAVDESSALLTVSDDGIGMNVAEAMNPSSLGLLGMVERATLIGGNVIFRRRPAGGTEVQARIPNVSRPQEREVSP